MRALMCVFLSRSANGDGSCVSDNSPSLACASTRLVRNQPALPVSSSFSGRPGAPPVLSSSTLSSLLVSSAVKPLGGSVSSQPRSQPPANALSWCLKTWREASCLLCCHIFSLGSQSSITCVQCLAEPPPFLFQPPSLSPHQGCQEAGFKRSLPLSLISA